MPISNVVFLRSTIALLLFGLATLLVIVGLTAWLSVKAGDYSAEVLRGRQIRSALVESRSLLQDTEVGQRGFLLTRQNDCFQPYERARARIGERIAALETLVISAPEREKVRRLERIVAASWPS